jgi:hypothetical protein
MSNQVEVRVFEKTDREGSPYMIGSTRLPASVKLDEVTFVVFYPEEGTEEGTLIIRPNRRVTGRTQTSDDDTKHRD